MILHKRVAYGIIDLLGDLGGVLEVIVAVLGVMILPISKYSFELKVLENMFIVHTK